MADTQVREVMTDEVVVLGTEDSIHEAARRMAKAHITGAPVVEEGRVIGIVTESDILDAMASGAPVSGPFNWVDAVSLMVAETYPRHVAERKVGDIMRKHVITTTPDASIWSAAAIMQMRGVNRLPVVSEGDLVGIVSRADLIEAMARDDVTLRRELLASFGVLGEEVFSDLDVTVEDGVATIYGSADRKSTHDIALRMASRTPGIVQVRDHLDFTYDDSHVMVPPGVPLDLDPRRNWNEMAR